MLVVLLLATFAFGQTTPPAQTAPAPPQLQVQVTTNEVPANPADVKSLDATMHSIYEVISGPAGQKRDWNRFRSLFVPGARLIPVSPKREGAGFNVRVITPDEYASRAQGMFDQQGFFESEVTRRVEQFGQIAQVFSTYESRHAAGDQPFQRGINSFQLFNDGQRWWIVTIYWQGETKDTPIPAEFLKK
jgi:hypothetical protein